MESQTGTHFFLCRLIPPRRDFAETMSAEERDVMLAHVQYWTNHLQQGNVIAFGPIADPAGDWGLGIIRASDLAEVEGFRDADPAIMSGRGFRYEVLPFVRLVTAPTPPVAAS